MTTRRIGVSPQAMYQSFKGRLISGEFAAGERLRPDRFRDEYGMGATAIREVFLRLTGEQLLTTEEQRGFHMPEASFEKLEETLAYRLLLEAEGARLAFLHGDLEWEARLYAAHHKLAHIEHRMNEMAEIKPVIPVWTRIDWEFHEVLMSACPSTTLREAHRNSFERYRQQVVAILPTYGFRPETIPQHAAILKAATERDAEACRRAIEAHLTSHRDLIVERKTDPREGSGANETRRAANIETS
ncbi:MAG: GntR family transcriptional regulator [Pseudomonadota bacterium]|nr:GntR family transcriptional regulator [Pseudomonadota bacterium]